MVLVAITVLGFLQERRVQKYLVDVTKSDRKLLLQRQPFFAAAANYFLEATSFFVAPAKLFVAATNTVCCSAFFYVAGTKLFVATTLSSVVLNFVTVTKSIVLCAGCDDLNCKRHSLQGISA